MKTASDTLFQLIQSLTKSEKRYFRQYAQRHVIGDENQYLSLFDAISAQAQYDETALKQALADQPYAHYFAVAKQYLYEQIVASLHQFHQAQSPEEQIKRQLHIAKILWRKRLTAQARKALAKAQKDIERHGLWDYLPEAESVERRLLRGQRDLTPALVQAAHEALASGLSILHQNNDYWLHSHRILSLHYSKVAVQHTANRALLDESYAWLQAQGQPAAPLVRLDYYRALATYHFMNGDARGASGYNRQLLDLFDLGRFSGKWHILGYNRQLLDLFEAHPLLIETEREQYVSVFSNFLIDTYSMGNYAEAEAGIERLRLLLQEPVFRQLPQLEVKILELTYSLQLNLRIAQQRFEEALALLPDVAGILARYGERVALNYRLTFWYLMAYILFRNRRYEDALTQLDRLRDGAYKTVLEELVQAADRLYLICHFQLGNTLLLEHLLVAAQRAQRRRKSPSAVDLCLFKYLKKLLGAANAQERRRWASALQQELETVKKTQPRAWIYFDFEAWLAGLSL